MSESSGHKFNNPDSEILAQMIHGLSKKIHGLSKKIDINGAFLGGLIGTVMEDRIKHRIEREKGEGWAKTGLFFSLRDLVKHIYRNRVEVFQEGGNLQSCSTQRMNFVNMKTNEISQKILKEYQKSKVWQNAYAAALEMSLLVTLGGKKFIKNPDLRKLLMKYIEKISSENPSCSEKSLTLLISMIAGKTRIEEKCSKFTSYQRIINFLQTMKEASDGSDSIFDPCRNTVFSMLSFRESGLLDEIELDCRGNCVINDQYCYFTFGEIKKGVMGNKHVGKGNKQLCRFYHLLCVLMKIINGDNCSIKGKGFLYIVRGGREKTSKTLHDVKVNLPNWYNSFVAFCKQKKEESAKKFNDLEKLQKEVDALKVLLRVKVVSSNKNESAFDLDSLFDSKETIEIDNSSPRQQEEELEKEFHSKMVLLENFPKDIQLSKKFWEKVVERVDHLSKVFEQMNEQHWKKIGLGKSSQFPIITKYC